MSSFVARYTSFLFAPYILAFDVLWGHLLGHLLIRRGGGVLLEILGGGVPPGSPNPDPISDFRPGL